MKYLALACDYDGTIAEDGQVREEVRAGLEAWRAADRRLILLTGRLLPDLQAVAPPLTLFDRVIAENGGLLYRPSTGDQVPLGLPPPDIFLEQLREKEVAPLARGRVIVATHQPHETTVLGVIKEQGLELAVTFNKGAVMILPSGINKATGLKIALAEINTPATHVVGVGDGENDHSFLERCGLSCTVGNAVPILKKHVSFTASQSDGRGVLEILRKVRAMDPDILEKPVTAPRGSVSK